MPTPSLILVPARFKTGKLYTPVATTSGGLVLGASGDFNVTRATTATRVNASGFIESVASGIPRLDYYTSGGTAGCPALLVEPSGSNIMAQSETLSVNANWLQIAVLTTGGVIASPDGLVSGSLLVATSASGTQHSINRSTATALTSGAVYTLSCFFKAHGTNNFAQLVIGGIAFSSVNPFANFSLTGSGSVTTGTYSSAFIQNYGNGWYRCGFTVTAAANGTPNCAICPILSGTTGRADNFTGDGVNGVYAWGFQVDTGPVATSYIPTTSAAVTRNADVINLTGAVSGCIGQTEGTIYAEIVAQPHNNTSFPAILQVDDDSDNQRFAIFYVQPSGGIRVRFNASGVNTNLDSTNPATLVVGQTYKIAAAFGFNGSQALYINGVFQVSGSVTAGPFTATLNRVMLGNRVGIISPFLIRSAALYTTRLSNAELAALTTL
jgi:hypothetical protein